jgi:phosphoribosylglycinamide formyltransferase-1
LCNNQKAAVVESVKKLGVEVIIVSNEQIEDSKFLIDTCNYYNINLIALAGFLRKLPNNFLNTYLNQVINIHPSLLPKYGGLGMYGDKIHKLVLENKEVETGITIHFVNEEYDSGEIIAQFTTEIDESDELENIKEKISKLEKIYYPYVIETILV